MYRKNQNKASIKDSFKMNFKVMNGCHLLNPKRAILYITKDKWIYLKLSLFCKMLWKGRSRKWIWIILKICKPIYNSFRCMIKLKNDLSFLQNWFKIVISFEKFFPGIINKGIIRANKLTFIAIVIRVGRVWFRRSWSFLITIFYYFP